MMKTVHGKAYGRTIELDEDLGVSEGEAVEVQVTVVSPADQEPGAGFLRTEGALADDKEWDAIMAEIHLSRKDERCGETPDLPAP